MVSILFENIDGFLIADSTYSYNWSELIDSSKHTLATIVLVDRSTHYIGRTLIDGQYILGKVNMDTGMMQTTDDGGDTLDFPCYQILTCNAGKRN